MDGMGEERAVTVPCVRVSIASGSTVLYCCTVRRLGRDLCVTADRIGAYEEMFPTGAARAGRQDGNQ